MQFMPLEMGEESLERHVIYLPMAFPRANVESCGPRKGIDTKRWVTTDRGGKSIARVYTLPSKNEN